MTLDGAIILLKKYEHGASSIAREDFLEATKLGIEALKRVRDRRKFKPIYHVKLLLGETKAVSPERISPNG